MGNKQSKKVAVNDYSVVTVPKNYKLIKLISYCVDLRISANSDLKILGIVDYIFSVTKNKSADIINLQCINDILSLHLLIREIKKYGVEHNLELYFAPEFNDIDTENKPDNGKTLRRSKNLEDLYSGNNSRDATEKKSEKKPNKKVIHNIIISKYPIIDTIFAELDNKTNMDDIFGIQTVIGANILIDNTIISVYNTCLSKDFKTSNIMNSEVRTTEIETLCSTINKNKILLQNNKSTNYCKSDIHLVIGNFNISEIMNGEVNFEYINLLKNTICIDVFRHKFLTEFGYTTSYKERNSYILLQISENICNDIEKINYEDVLNVLFKTYKIHFLDLSVVTINKNIINYPIECICMIKTS
jgi:hypothetical protein